MERVTPQALDVEEAVLGTALLESKTVDMVSALPSDIFYSPKNKIIHESIRMLRANSSPVDILTLKKHLQGRNILKQAGGVAYLTSITGRVAGSANIEAHIGILMQKYSARKLISAFSGGIEGLYDTGNVLDVVGKIDSTLVEISNLSSSRKSKTMQEIAMDYLERLEKQIASDSNIIGIPSGIPSLDRYTLGFQKTELTIIGARPSMGKTDHGLFVAFSAAKMGYKTAMISLEMSETKLMQRLVAMETGFNKQVLNSGDKEELLNEDGFLKPEIHEATNTIIKSGLTLCDMGSASYPAIRHKCAELVRSGVELIVIDYLGLIELDRKTYRTTNDGVGAISRGLKMDVAKELDCSVIALHQLSRAVETRGGDKRPILSDLRDSGNIEQDADRVYFLYRPEYYGEELDEEGNHTGGRIEFIIAKNREGLTGTVRAFYDSGTGRAADVAATLGHGGIIPEPAWNGHHNGEAPF